MRTSGTTVREVARDLGCSSESSRLWIKQTRIDAGEEEGLTSDEQAELRELRRKVRVLENRIRRLFHYVARGDVLEAAVQRPRTLRQVLLHPNDLASHPAEDGRDGLGCFARSRYLAET